VEISNLLSSKSVKHRLLSPHRKNGILLHERAEIGRIHNLLGLWSLMRFGERLFCCLMCVLFDVCSV